MSGIVSTVAPSLPARYTLPAVVLTVVPDSAALHDAFDRSFCLCRGDGPGDEIVLRLHLVHAGQSTPELPRWLAEQLTAMPASRDVRWVAGPADESAVGAVSDQSAACAWLSAAKDEIRLFVFMRHAGRSAIAMQPLLVPMLREVFRARGRLLLHAAAVQYREGLGTLIVAEPGGGKTTTALSLVRHGARLLADDLVVVREHGGGFEAEGIPERLNLTDATLRLLPELERVRARPVHDSGKPKTSVAPQEIYGPACMAPSSAVRAILFPSVGGERPALRRIPAIEATGRLIRAHTFARDQHMSEEALGWIAGLATRSAALALTTGPDPAALGPWLIDQLADRAGTAA